MIYIAQPYSGSLEAREIRYQIGMAYTAHLMKTGTVGVYSPITHCHVMAKDHSLPTDAESWKKENFYMLSLSTEMHILQISGWRNSRGLYLERTYCDDHRIIKRFIPETYITQNIPGANPWLQKLNALRIG